MEMVTISGKGEIIIPQALREAYAWQTSQELIAIDTGDGILLQAKPFFTPTTLHHVAGCLAYKGTP